jgi:hypothetical protein
MNHRTLILSAFWTLALPLCAAAQQAHAESATPAPASAKFAPAQMLQAGGKPIRTESPGYASPEVYDVDGDGHKDMVVGQFAGGKIKVYPGLGQGKFGAGKWLQADGKDVEVPGVW